MIKGEYKKVLWEIFDALGFFEDEREKALEGFKKKFANELFGKLRDTLNEDQRQWVATVVSKKEYDKNDPMVVDIQKTIDLALEKDEFYRISKATFKKILSSYVDFMAQKVSSEKSQKLMEIVNNF